MAKLDWEGANARERARAGLDQERNNDQFGWLPQTPDHPDPHGHVRAALAWVRNFDWKSRAAFFDADYLFKRDMARMARSCVLRPTIDQGEFLVELWDRSLCDYEPF